MRSWRNFAASTSGRKGVESGMLSERIQRLKAVPPTTPWLARYKLWAFEGLRRAAPGLSRILRIAAGWRRLAEDVAVEIHDDDVLLGSTLCGELTAEEKRLAGEHQAVRGAQLPNGWGGISAHMAIDNELLLATGLRGALKRIDEKERALDLGDPAGAQSRDFYRAARCALQAVRRLAERYAEAAERLAGRAADRDRAEELRRMARMCRRVPYEPARNFHEAVQSVWFMFLLTSAEAGLMSLGRMDQYLEPFYRRDLRSGETTPERAKEILQALFVKLNQITTSPQSIIVGGVDREGRPVENDLTRLILEAVGELRMVNPALGLAVNEHTSERIMLKACEMVASGLSHPAFYCDETIIAGLERIGVAREHARRYINCTCTEMTPEGYSGIWVVADYMNFAQCLLRVLHGGVDPDEPELEVPRTGALEEPTSFGKVLDALKRQLDHTVRENCMRMNRHARVRAASGSWPLLSCFVHDCIETGRDIDEGGARYKFFYPQLVGLATVTDSLVAIKHLVFEEGSMSLAELRDVLACDFAGHEKLRAFVANKLPKYGTNDPEPDALALELFDHYVNEVEKYRNPYGARYHAGFLAWIQHGKLGEATGATPDGRRAGCALSDSFAAAQGRARRGATGVLESVEKFDLSKAIGAVVVNLRFDKRSLRGAKGRRALADLVRTHFRRGGFQIQVTVADREDLLRAKREPEKFEDLMVRVGGFSEYFVRLDETLQDEIIRRTE